MELAKILELLFGYVALATTMIGLIPQVYKAYRTKSTSDISWIMLWNCLICSGSWIIYGVITHSAFVVWSNILGTITSVISLLQKRYYDAV